MPSHCWGDGFDFDMLNGAGAWISKFYRRKTGKNILWKEKYGVLCFELIYTWVSSPKDTVVFYEVLKRACVKFSKIKCEIIFDIYEDCDYSYYKGYFEAVLDSEGK